MGHFLSLVLHTVRRNLLVFTLIVLVLVAGKWIRSESVQVQSIVGELPALRSAQTDVEHQQASLAHAIAQQVARLSGAPVAQLDVEILALENDIARLQRADAPLSSDALKGSDWMVEQLRQRARREVDIALRRQARDHLTAVRAHLVVLSNRQAALQKREELLQTHVQAYAALQRAQQALTQFQAVAGVLARLPFTTGYRQMRRLEQDVSDLGAANRLAHQEHVAQQAVLARLSLPAAISQFRVDEQQLAQAGAPLRRRLMQAETMAERSHFWKAYQAVRPVLPVAMAIMIGWWVLPAAVRTLFYFVLAPQAARRPPIVISARTKSPAAPPAYPGLARDSSVISAVSQMMTLAPDHEMLIRPDYCQSQSAGVSITTKMLFNWRHVFTSIAAQLWMLKRLRTTQAAGIVVSSTADALDEVALLDIAAGEAFVLQPRALVGMLYQTGQRPRIRSHWRLGTLHAWLTFQLRYLAFEGPATLIVKGCRGVRLESASTGRTISQDATLGFSANARYATIRAEPFIPYLRGRQALFHDKFDGPDACCLYEEVPRNARPGGHKRNPLEGLLDASLKAFGI